MLLATLTYQIAATHKALALSTLGIGVLALALARYALTQSDPQRAHIPRPELPVRDLQDPAEDIQSTSETLSHASSSDTLSEISRAETQSLNTESPRNNTIAQTWQYELVDSPVIENAAHVPANPTQNSDEVHTPELPPRGPHMQHDVERSVHHYAAASLWWL